MEVHNGSLDATVVGVFLLYANVIKEAMRIMPTTSTHPIKTGYSVAYCGTGKKRIASTL